MNASAFDGTNFVFSRLTDHGEEERKRHDLALKKLERAYINNVDEAMLEYYRVFGKQINPLPPESQLSDFHHPSEDQKNGELLFVAVGTGIATYALYRYLK